MRAHHARFQVDLFQTLHKPHIKVGSLLSQRLYISASKDHLSKKCILLPFDILIQCHKVLFQKTCLFIQFSSEKVQFLQGQVLLHLQSGEHIRCLLLQVSGKGAVAFHPALCHFGYFEAFAGDYDGAVLAEMHGIVGTLQSSELSRSVEVVQTNRPFDHFLGAGRVVSFVFFLRGLLMAMCLLIREPLAFKLLLRCV